MLFEREPDISLTGGVFYSQEDLDMTFIEAMLSSCKYRTPINNHAFDCSILQVLFFFFSPPHFSSFPRTGHQIMLEQQRKFGTTLADDPFFNFEYSASTAAEILREVQRKDVAKQPLNINDINRLLDVLVHDGLASVVKIEGQPVRYFARIIAAPKGGLMATPCGVCPVAEQCHEGGIISPLTCPYLTDW